MRPYIATALATLLMFAAPAAAIKPAKLLAKLRAVDGAGSGLDADTLRGKTPEQVGSEALAAIAAGSYGLGAGVSIAPGLCDCVQIGCRENDFRINCNGGFVPFPSNGYLSAVAAVPNTFNVCAACGCNVGDGAAELDVGVICLPVP
jgi:hypothetical protein